MKNILFLMTDQQRADYTGIGGKPYFSTKNIEKLKDGFTFSNCVSTNPYCTPARCCIATGKYSHQIGMLQMSGDLDRQHPTIFQSLQKAHYATSAIGKLHYLQTWPWDRERGKGVDGIAIHDKMKEYGFDYLYEMEGKQLLLRNVSDYGKLLQKKGLLGKYRDFVEKAGENHEDANILPEDNCLTWPFEESLYPDVIIADHVIQQIKERNKEKPFFIMGSFLSPHKPFDPPQRYLDTIPYEEVDDFIINEDSPLSEEAKKALYVKRRAYKALIQLIDDQIGRIITTLKDEKLMDDTLIVFTADHGEMMGDHSFLQKGTYYKEATTVPLIIRDPDHLTHTTISDPVELIDVSATILDYAGIDYTQGLSRRWPAFNNIVPCESLKPLITEGEKRKKDFAFSECEARYQMIQTNKGKYVKHLPRDHYKVKEEYFDLLHNPDETINEIYNPTFQKEIHYCRSQLENLMDSTPSAQLRWAPLMDICSE